MPTIILSQSRRYKQLYFTYSSASFEHVTIILSQRAGSITSCISATRQPVLIMRPSHSHRAGSTNSCISAICQPVLNMRPSHSHRAGSINSCISVICQPVLNMQLQHCVLTVHRTMSYWTIHRAVPPHI